MVNHFWTMFVAGLIAMLGILGCVIGIVFTMSIIYLPSFLIYKDAIGFDGTHGIDDVTMQE